MLERLKQIYEWARGKAGYSLLIIAAALLLEAISAVQYTYVHNVIDTALDRRAESEISMKGNLIRNMLHQGEGTLRHHIWDVARNFDEPDSIYGAVSRMIRFDPTIIGGAVAFKHNYYKSKGMYFEPYAYRSGDSIITMQRGGPDHDYTQMEFYRKAISTGEKYWTDPYTDDESGKQIATLSIPVTKKRKETFQKADPDDIIGVIGLDMSMEWLNDTLNTRHIFPSSFCFLLTEDGRLVTQPTAAQADSTDVARAVATINDSTVLYSISSERHISCKEFHSDKFDESAYVYYHSMRGNPHWQIAVVCYDHEAFAPAYTMRRNMLLLMLLGFGILGFILWRVMRSNRRLHETQLEQQRLESELQVGRKIQRDMLPDAQATMHNVTIAGLLEPAREVGGDLFDYFVRDDKLYFCIGDVSGKGVPSALVMAVTHSMFRTIGARESNPARIMEKINHSSCQNNEACMFVTFFIGVLDLPTGRLRYCNAGHDAPIEVRTGLPPAPPKGGELEATLLDVKSNLPLGVDSGWPFEAQETQLSPGDTLLLYTDGITEAMNESHEQFGLDRLLKSIAPSFRRGLGEDAQEIIPTVVNAVKTFVGTAEQSDDITMLAVTWQPEAERLTFDRTITVTNDLKQVHEVNSFVEGVTAELAMEHSDAANVKLAVEEVVVNVINYAYPTGETGNIDITAKASATELRFIISDSGTPFAPTDAPDVDTTLSAEERQIGGLGIFLVRQLMDTINYERHASHNILTLTKKLKSREQ